MRRSWHHFPRLACCTLLLGVAGCGLPVSTMHGAAPVPVNTGAVMIGVEPIFLEGAGEEKFLLASLIFGAFGSLRYGVSERLEVGASSGMLNGFTVEAKYNLVPGPLFVSTNLAASTGIVIDILDVGGGDDSDLVSNFGIHSALLIGTERIYGGAKLMIYPTALHPRPWTVLSAGGSFGGDTRLVPEFPWLRRSADGDTSWLLGIALQRRVRQFFR